MSADELYHPNQAAYVDKGMEEETESAIQNLPEELLLKILSYPELGSKTLLNFGETCKKFNNIVQDPILWKKKLQTRYRNIYEGILLHGTEDYFEQYQYVHKTENTILGELKEMSPKYFWRSTDPTIDGTNTYFKLCKDRNISLMCVHSILVDIIKKSGQVIESDYPSTSPYTLTVQYYAKHVIRIIMHVFLMINWHAMILVLKVETVERAINFYGNWINTLQYTDYIEVKNMLDSLADEVIKEIPPNHPIHAIPTESRAVWSEEPLVDNMWDLEHNHAVQSAIRNVIYAKRDMKMELKISFKSIHIPQILKRNKGHMIALAALYEAVARRCGLKCCVVFFTNHFFLEWFESYTQPSPQFTINLSNGNVERKRTCPFTGFSTKHTSDDNSPELIIESLAEQFREMQLKHERVTTLRSTIETLEEMINGTPVQYERRYYVKYAHLFSSKALTQLVVERPHACFQNLDEDYRQLMVEFASKFEYLAGYTKPKRTVYRNRSSSHVHLAVGMVCSHRMYNYTCVVTGWDPLCAAPRDWQARMGVHLTYKAKQPFYHVYATDGSTSYVAQENLKIIVGQRPKIIEDVIGKEFSHFNGTYYIPNLEKQKEYPDEQLVIAAYRRAPTLLSVQGATGAGQGQVQLESCGSSPKTISP